MIKQLIFLPILFLYSFSVSAQTCDDEVTTSLTKEMENNVQQWMEAYNGGDTNILATFYSEDAEYISAHVTGLVATGRDRVIENFRNGINMGGHINKINIISINRSCNMVVLVSRYEANNNGEIAVGRNLLVLKMIDGKWLIIKHMTVV